MKKILLSLSFCVTAGTAGAANFTVNSNADAVDAAPGNGVCAASGGACTLRAAVMEANALIGADVIAVSAGIFALAIPGSGEDQAATGDLDIADDLTIVGAGAGVTIFHGGGVDRLFEIPASPGFVAVTIRDATLRNGRIVDAAGAGIRHADDGTLLIENAEFLDNRVLDPASSGNIGGGIASIGIGELEIRSSTFEANAADRGGALFVNGSLTLLDSTLAGNQARNGSAIASYADATIERSAVLTNVAPAGFAVSVSAGSMQIRNTTFSGNAGAGLVFVDPATTLGFESATLFDNQVTKALFVSGLVALSSTAIANPGASMECDVSGTLISTGFNLDGDGTCVGAGEGDLPSADPQLGPLADNGGPTLSHAPLGGSPLIDSGDPSLCPPVDQRGSPRPVDADGDSLAECDIGAIEAAPEAGAVANAAAALAGVRLLAARGSRSRRRS